MSHEAVITFDSVSKSFRLEESRSRSFLEAFTSVFQEPPEREAFWVLRDADFQIYEGEFVGLIGANGAGKSTSLKLISKIIEPTTGHVWSRGRIGALLELGAGFHPELSGRENIYLNASVMGLERSYVDEYFDEIVAFSELEDFIDVPVKHYSSGMYVRLGFSVAIHARPDILLIDEVLAVGDEAFQHKCIDRITRLRRSGVTILLVTHGLNTVESLCDRAIWFEQGRVEGIGDSRDVVMAYRNHVSQLERNQDTATVRDKESDDQYQWGSQEVEITSVELVDQAGEQTNVFKSNQSMDIYVHYQCNTDVDEIVIGLAFYHQNGAHISGPNTKFAGHVIDDVAERGVLRYHIPSLPLLEGAYELSVSIVGETMMEIYDYHDRLYPFRVYRGESREIYGLVTFGGEWASEITRNSVNDGR
jgi:lipopolysaccharide transport system ATP-binding protein